MKKLIALLLVTVMLLGTAYAEGNTTYTAMKYMLKNPDSKGMYLGEERYTQAVGDQIDMVELFVDMDKGIVILLGNNEKMVCELTVWTDLTAIQTLMTVMNNCKYADVLEESLSGAKQISITVRKNDTLAVLTGAESAKQWVEDMLSDW